MKIALAQVNFSLGAFDQNCRQTIKILEKTKNKADLLAFPEGGLWGYPPKDFLYNEECFNIQEQKIRLIKRHLPKGLSLLLPAFVKRADIIQTGAFLFEKGKKTRFFAKEFLPDKGVFFESRYFKKGESEKNFFYWKNKKIQILICEDLWKIHSLKKPDVVISLNGSPYTDQKPKNRLKIMREIVKKYSCPAVYLNRVGGQDSLIFDGGSFALNPKGEILWQGRFFEPDFKIINVLSPGSLKRAKKKDKALFPPLQQQRIQALVLGLQDFFLQTGFSKALIGLSGGMDSALVAYLAVLALGKKNVQVCFLPGPYTAKTSYKIVKQVSENLKIPIQEKSITPLFSVCLESLLDKKNHINSLVAQNLQARLRTLILMARANQSSSLLLATGNKSELATGYCTLYGDMAGALCPIGDLFKSQVYDMARFINKKTACFPKALLSREPSAELLANQKDRDDLPPYKTLDPLLDNILKNKPSQSPEEKRLSLLVQTQEFKRKQAPPILKLSSTDLGESRKHPIAHRFYSDLF